MLTTTDPRTGQTRSTGIAPTAPEQVDSLALRAGEAQAELDGLGRHGRAGLLEALAAGLEANRAELVDTAVSETGLTTARLDGELTRSAFQFRLFAEVLRDGGYLEATIDHAGPTPMGPGPDVRRMLVPLGPVAVFGSSNFPFAFSVPGGDTASALAAGCPVVLKAHGSHPLTSRLAFQVLDEAARAAGAPAGTLGIVYGTDAGAALVAHPAIQAVGFTGSLDTGRILLDIIGRRAQPIPFYGELSSLNPLVVTPAAAAARGPEIAAGLAASVTGSAGQLCTKPGLAFVPREADDLVARLRELAAATSPQPLLNARILAALGGIRERLVRDGGATVLLEGGAGPDGFQVSPTVLEIDAAAVTEAVAEEAFGPLVVVVRYDGLEQVAAALDRVPASLTATIHSGGEDDPLLAPLLALVRARAGRIVFDGFPTGVRVGWAQHHGGPWPSTNSIHTSVGATAIRRFLRPLAWQDAPAALLPTELRDGEVELPRRVDGRLVPGTNR